MYPTHHCARPRLLSYFVSPLLLTKGKPSLPDSLFHYSPFTLSGQCKKGVKLMYYTLDMCQSRIQGHWCKWKWCQFTFPMCIEATRAHSDTVEAASCSRPECGPFSHLFFLSYLTSFTFSLFVLSIKSYRALHTRGGQTASAAVGIRLISMASHHLGFTWELFSEGAYFPGGSEAGVTDIWAQHG